MSRTWWEVYAAKCAGWDRVVLYDQARELLTRSVCQWAGVPLPEDEVLTRTAEPSAMFDRAGSLGLGHLWSRLGRMAGNHWARQLIESVRRGDLTPPPDAALTLVANHRDPQGLLLPPHVAAVELLNILRPTVAVAVYVVFVAWALEEFTDCRSEALEGGPEYDRCFVEEVRRFFPFFPAVAARVRHDFEWRGLRFPAGRRTLLDLYGTCHDPRAWYEPDRFHPRRLSGTPDPTAPAAGPDDADACDYPHDRFAFIPQGGGAAAETHRCPGEEVALELMLVALDQLTRRMTYTVPPQDRTIDFTRLPALPRDRFVLREVRPVTES